MDECWSTPGNRLMQVHPEQWKNSGPPQAMYRQYQLLYQDRETRRGVTTIREFKKLSWPLQRKRHFMLVTLYEMGEVSFH